MEREQELTLKEVLVFVGGYLVLIKKRWLWLLLAGCLGAGYLFYSATQTPVRFISELTFVVNEDSPSAGGGVGSILGQIGLGGGGKGQFNLEKIIALAESGKIANDLLLDSVAVDGNTDKFANHIVREYDLVNEWETEEGFPLIAGDSLQHLNRNEKKYLKRLYRMLFNGDDKLFDVSSEDLTGILSIKATTTSEDLSLVLTENLYARLSAFYTAESIGSSQASLDRLVFKRDSIKKALDAADYSLARSYDRSQGVTQQQNLVRQAQLNREVQLLSFAYGEILKNLEQSSFLLATKTPFFQVVDQPFLPLSAVAVNPLEQAVVGFILGFFVLLLLFCVQKFYRDVMNEGETLSHPITEHEGR